MQRHPRKYEIATLFSLLFQAGGESSVKNDVWLFEFHPPHLNNFFNRNNFKRGEREARKRNPINFLYSDFNSIWDRIFHV